MSARVMIYQLERKFVQERPPAQEAVQQVVYYTLAVGHHMGVLDCFAPLAEAPLSEFMAWLQALPPGEGRRKLEGVLRWGEIEVKREHVPLLLPLFSSGEETPPAWVTSLYQALGALQREAARYLVLRKVA